MKNTLIYKSLRATLLSILYELPIAREWAYRRLPRHQQNYKHYWQDDKKNIFEMEERQAQLPLSYLSPTRNEMLAFFHKYNAKTILDIGCGFGRSIEHLRIENIDGCDYSDDLLAEAKKRGHNVFKLDLVEPHEVGKQWDVSYAMLVFSFFIDRPDEMRKAMQTADRLTKKKILICDWKHICDYMQSVYPSDKFEYYHLPFPA